MSKLSHILKAMKSYFYITILPWILVMSLQHRHVYTPLVSNSGLIHLLPSNRPSKENPLDGSKRVFILHYIN